MGQQSNVLGRPLKSILAVFDGKKIDFNFHHLKSSNYTFLDKDFEEKIKILITLNLIISYFKSKKLFLIKIKEKNLLLMN